MPDNNDQSMNAILEYIRENPAMLNDIYSAFDDMAAQNPNSKVSKEWKNAKKDIEASDIINSIDENNAAVKHDYEGWNDTYANMYGHESMSPDINEIILPTIGDVAKAWGGYEAATKGILGSALMSMANNMHENTGPYAEVSKLMDRGAKKAGIIEGAKLAAKGAGMGVIGKAAGDTIQNIADTLSQRQEQARTTTLLENENPSGEFYKTVRALKK